MARKYITLQHFRATEEVERATEAAAREATEEAARGAGANGEDKLDDQSKDGTWMTIPQLSNVSVNEESNELHDGHRTL